MQTNTKKLIVVLVVVFLFVVYGLVEQSPSLPPTSVPVTTTQPVAPKFSAPASVPKPTPTPAPARAVAPTPSPAPPPRGVYANGTYTGTVADAFYGNVQVQAVVRGGRLTDVIFLDYPHDRGTSREINGQATPLLTQEAVQVQSASVDIISGATQTSLAFRDSLGVALAHAKN